jgi:hypothetical protein
MFKRINTSVLLWAGIALLLLAAIYAPVSRSDIADEPTQIARMDAFSPLVIAVDNQLQQGEALALTTSQLAEMTPILQSRRLLLTGPMTAEELREALSMLRIFHYDIESQRQEGSRQTLRNHRARTLAERFPRLDAERIGPVLDQLRMELEAAAVVSPRPSEQP